MLKQLTGSLSSRLAFTSFIFLLLFLGLTGYVLDRAFKASIENAVYERLRNHIYALLSAVEDEGEQLAMPTVLPNPEFMRINSGLYAAISTQDNQLLWRSPSAEGLKLIPQTRLSTGSFSFSTSSETEKKMDLYSLHYGIIWENEKNRAQSYTFAIWQDKQPIIAELHGFRTTLRLWLGGIGLLLLGIQASILHWGLAPLRGLANDLKKMEEGKQDHLTGTYPAELQHITINLNLLLSNERRQRQRYRNTLADLAHSLKTPLAIMHCLTEKLPASSANAIDEQLERMDQIVTYQLQRASTPHTRFTTQAVPVKPILEKLLRNLSKVYHAKSVHYEILADTQGDFYGDKRDLMEMLGNILDNAFKASRKVIRATVEQPANKSLLIRIEDDGPGIAREVQDNILQRGVRADSTSPGQGIGLAVTRDIALSYKGELQIKTSPMGGACFILKFAN